MLKMFIALLSFINSLATKFLILNDESCMVRHTVVDMNPNELKFYSFMITFNKYARSCNVLTPKVYIPKETKDIYVKAFNTITSKDEAKAIKEYIS